MPTTTEKIMPKKRRRKLDQYLRKVREDEEVVLQEMTNLSNRLFRLLVGMAFTLGLVFLIHPFPWQSGWPAAVGVTMILFLANGLGWLLLGRIQKRVFDRPAGFNQLIFLFLLTMLASKFIFVLEWSPFLAPIPMLGMVMALTFGQPASFFLVVAASFYLGFMSPGAERFFFLGLDPLEAEKLNMHFDFELMLILSLGGVASVLGMSTLRQQSRPVVVGVYAGLVQAAVVLGFQLVIGNPESGEMITFRDLNPRENLPLFLEDPAWALAGGVFSGAVVTCLLPALERFFGIVTERRLLAFTDPNNELLQALRNRAPGTHTHTLRVADLASAAAEAIGADPLLAQVGAYYHDAGKITKPDYFVENTESSQNIHDRLRPSMSKLVIISHIKEGIELAEEAGLPKKIVDMIPMHHGTTVVEYFFHKAKTEGDPAKTEVEYRYPGPKPRFREAGILMLADSVEAAAKTITEPNPGRFRDMVHEHILKRLTDHQLDESDLTMRDLKRIEDSFVYTLTYMYHGRIKYPEEESGHREGPVQRAVPVSPQGRGPDGEGALPAGAALRSSETPPQSSNLPSNEPHSHHHQPAEISSATSNPPSKNSGRNS